METVLIDIDSRGVATVTFNRPDVHNAFDDAMIVSLTAHLKKLDVDENVRAVVVRGNGKSFSAGADLNWMKRTADYSYDQNLADAQDLAEMLWILNRLSKPTVAVVQGAAYGGGVGLVGACDIVIASDLAKFRLSEARLGIMASVISPYVLAAIGESQARRYTLTAEPFGAADARRIGLVHEVVDAGDLDGKAEEILSLLLQNGPAAMSAIKGLVFSLQGRSFDETVVRETAEGIARVRASDEGKEGISAFLDKRKANWVRD